MNRHEFLQVLAAASAAGFALDSPDLLAPQGGERLMTCPATAMSICCTSPIATRMIGTLVGPWVSQIWALGGARGILIGVALGTLTTGLRVLFGLDRTYRGK